MQQRDLIFMAMAALSELDDRQVAAGCGRRNNINFSGSLFNSDDANYLEMVACDRFPNWSDQKLYQLVEAIAAKKPVEEILELIQSI